MGKTFKKIAMAPITGGLSLAGDKGVAGTIGGALNQQVKGPGAITINEDPFKNQQRTRAAREGLQGMSAQLESERRATGSNLTGARSQQQQLVGALQRQAAGQGPSIAEAQLRQAQDRSLSQQLAAAAAARGGNAALNQRSLARQAAASNQNIAQQAAQARMAEQLQAQQQLGQLTGQIRGQDLSQQQAALQGVLSSQNLIGSLARFEDQSLQDLERLKSQNALGISGLSQQARAANAAANNQLTGGLIQGGAAALAGSDKNMKKKIKKDKKSDATFLIKLSDEDKKKRKEEDTNKIKEFVNAFTENEDDKSSGSTKTGKGIGKLAGAGIKSLMSKGAGAGAGAGTASGIAGGAGGFASMLSASDEDTKKNKNKNTDLKKDFLDKLTAYSYEYKNPKEPGAAPGKQFSVMAQDLEKAGPVGKSMVVEDESGTKMVDYGRGFGAILASQANLNKRLNELEKRRKTKKA